MEKEFRPPAVPLITIDPYFSIWSFGDKLYETPTRHWSGVQNAMSGFLKIDRKWLKFMGMLETDSRQYATESEVIPQISVTVRPTVTTYFFENEAVSLKIEFISPLLMEDLYLLSRPVSYINYEITAKDSIEHEMEIYFDIGAECCVKDISDFVEIFYLDNSVCCGKGKQDLLKQCGDMLPIEWGWLYLVSPDAERMILSGSQKRELLENRNYELLEGIVRIADGFPVLAMRKKYGKTDFVSDFLCVAYDDIASIEYFGKKLKAYWTENGDTFPEILNKAVYEYPCIYKRCQNFDSYFEKRASKYGKKYCDIVSLCYRQVIAAHKLVKSDRLLFLSKECGSNGSIGTIDVLYPSIPMFLVFGPELARAMLDPVFDYVENHGWNFDFAPHDLGRYPFANGEITGYDPKTRQTDSTKQFPVEECGNMLICTAALCKRLKNFKYAEEHAETLEKWAEYLIKDGLDPAKQLCTDDFTGELAHNCNLSAKAILGIASWGYMLEKSGKNGKRYTDYARKYAEIWVDRAVQNNRSLLAFDKKNTWSLKYNLVWDSYFGWNLFPFEFKKNEIDFYKTQMKEYGVPLDCRNSYTKTDWQMWTACLIDEPEYRQNIIEKIWNFACETPVRVPFTDFYDTKIPLQMMHFQNRTVQGGLFFPMLMEDE